MRESRNIHLHHNTLHLNKSQQYSSYFGLRRNNKKLPNVLQLGLPAKNVEKVPHDNQTSKPRELTSVSESEIITN